MAASLNLAAKVRGLPAVILENEWLYASVLPSVGAKIYDLVWKPAHREILWHNPRIPPQTYPVDGNFDNYWCGGWDDAFPTCDACEYGGEQYPNLGELRSLEWQVETSVSDRDQAMVKLAVFGPISPVHVEKTITLLGGSPVLRLHYEITNLGPLPLDFMWGTHPGLVANENLVLKIPAKKGLVGQATDPAFGRPGQTYAWPHLETPVGITDMSRVMPVGAAVAGGHYALELQEGWYAVEDSRSGEGFLLKFPLEKCPYLWMWLVYGGWRGYYHLIVEPWTSYPNKLSEAAQHKTHRTLEPGGRFSVEIAATVYQRDEGRQGAWQRL